MGSQIVRSGYKETKVGVIPVDWGCLPSRNYFSKRIAKGYDGLETYSVFIDKSLKKRDELDREFRSELTVEECLLIEPNDLVYNTMRMWQGALGLAETAGVVSPAYIVIRPKPMMNSKFVFYMLKSYTYLHYLKSYSYGLTNDRLRLYYKDFGMIPFICPPLKEQEKIAEILSTWDEVILKQEELIKAKEELKKGLMQKLLSGEVRFKEFKDEWKEVRLEALSLKMQSGGTPKATNKSFYNGAIPFVKVNDITKNGKYLQRTQVCINEDGLKNSSTWIVPINSIIYSMYASVGFVTINKIKVATSQAMINIIPNLDKIKLEFLYYLLLDFKKIIHKFIETGTQGKLNAQIVKNLKLIIPSLQEQQKITEVLSHADNDIELLKNELEELKTQKKGLMQKLLTGQLRVKHEGF